MRKLKMTYYRWTQKIKFIRKRREKRLLVAVGASFLREARTSRELRRVVTSKCPSLNNRLFNLGINLKNWGK